MLSAAQKAKNMDVLRNMPERFMQARYHIFSKFDEVRIDRGFYEVCPENHALDIASRVSDGSVLDACSGLGGMTIAFARSGKQVTAIEIDGERQEKAKHNAKVYGVSDRITWHSGDVTQLQGVKVDTVFLDPPWGNGPGAYIKKDSISMEDLSLSGMDLRDLIGKISCRDVVMRIPTNFDLSVLPRSSDVISYLREYGEEKGQPTFSCLFLTKDDFLSIPRNG